LVANYLLGHNAYYMLYKKSRCFNLSCIKYHVSRITALSRPSRQADLAHDSEFLFFVPHQATSSLVYDDYIHCGPKLQ